MPFYFDMTVEELQASVQKNPFELDLWLALIQLVAKEECSENALDEIFIAEDLFPENVELQAIKSLCLMSLGETREAHELLQQSLRRSPGENMINRVVQDFLPSFESVTPDRLLNPQSIRESIEDNPSERDFVERLDSTIDLIHAFRESDGTFENLIEQLEQHVQQFPDDINAKLDLARLCYNNGYHKKSRLYYEAVIEEDPLCASAYFELATIDPDPRNAIRLSELALDLCPTFECGRYNYGTLLHKIGMVKEGRNELLRIPADSSYYVASLEAIANSYSHEGYLEKAIDTQEKVVALSPKDAEAWNCLGHFFAELGDYETALKKFDHVIGLDSEHLDGLHNRALMLSRLGRHEESVHVLKYALTIEPNSEPLLVNLAVELNCSERNDEAIELTQQSLERFPDNARMWLNLGSFQFEAGRFEEGIECSLKALEVDPTKAAAWLNIACSYALQGNRDECLTALKACLEVCPDLVFNVLMEESLQQFFHDPEFQELLSSTKSSL